MPITRAPRIGITMASSSAAVPRSPRSRSPRRRSRSGVDFAGRGDWFRCLRTWCAGAKPACSSPTSSGG